VQLAGKTNSAFVFIKVRHVFRPLS
jgi:hypothetical protein